MTTTKPACKYGVACYRRNAAHLSEYSHPAKPEDQKPVAPAPGSPHLAAPIPLSLGSDSDADDDLAEIDGVKPLRVLGDGETVTVSSKSSSSTYEIKRTFDHYYCKCPAWRNQSRAPVNGRSCKHLRELLGDAYEDARVKRFGGSFSAGSPTKKRKARGDDEDDEDDDGKNGSSSSSAPLKKVKVDVLLAQSYEIDGNVDPTGWWISEKLDGVRAYWDPKNRQFYSRLGNPFTPPDWFIDKLPKDMSLDGELFGGRGKFIETVSTVKTMNSKNWGKVTFQVFDAPSIGDQPFESRMKVLEELFMKTPIDHVKLVRQTLCTGQSHVLKMLKDVENVGGEGLMLRKPDSRYEKSRSNTLLKVKSFYDAEALVEGHEPGKGKNTGVMGALKCAMASGKKFRVGTGFTDKERANPPKIGSIITYRFQELTNDGVPRFPSFVGERIDMDKPKDAVARRSFYTKKARSAMGGIFAQFMGEAKEEIGDLNGNGNQKLDSPELEELMQKILPNEAILHRLYDDQRIGVEPKTQVRIVRRVLQAMRDSDGVDEDERDIVHGLLDSELWKLSLEDPNTLTTLAIVLSRHSTEGIPASITLLHSILRNNHHANAEYVLAQLIHAGLDPDYPPPDNTAAAIHMLDHLATGHGHPQACYTLASYFAASKDLQERKRVPELLLTAAEAGVGPAWTQLGVLYGSGQGIVETDLAKSLDCYEKAAALENPQGAFVAGTMWMDGKGTPDGTKDPAKGLEYIKQAAARGLPVAQHNLAIVHFTGLKDAAGSTILEVSIPTAVEYFKMAAEGKFQPSQINLAKLYLAGEHLPQSSVIARKYLSEAVALGGSVADDARKILQEMGEEEDTY
ncbi:hypothetical protein HDU93_005236 [Gonapodya sp. JEL0774]|nr:hypothetical protein HDU93_005236 [Gonapodya sp. JEL0774]